MAASVGEKLILIYKFWGKFLQITSNIFWVNRETTTYSGQHAQIVMDPLKDGVCNW